MAAARTASALPNGASRRAERHRAHALDPRQHDPRVALGVRQARPPPAASTSARPSGPRRPTPSIRRPPRATRRVGRRPEPRCLVEVRESDGRRRPRGPRWCARRAAAAPCRAPTVAPVRRGRPRARLSTGPEPARGPAELAPTHAAVGRRPRSRARCARRAAAIRPATTTRGLRRRPVDQHGRRDAVRRGTHRSIRSRSGPETRRRYRSGHARRAGARPDPSTPLMPHGHGFIAATSVNRAGKVTARPTRTTVTLPSSSGWRSASSTSRRTPGSSSQTSTPWSARVTSPGDMRGPPPTMPAYDDGVVRRAGTGDAAPAPAAGSSPATDATAVAASAAASSRSGRRPGIVRASIVLPDPGGPIRSIA